MPGESARYEEITMLVGGVLGGLAYDLCIPRHHPIEAPISQTATV